MAAKRYVPGTDEFVEVDQEWVDWTYKEFSHFGKCREVAKEIAKSDSPHAEMFDRFVKAWTPYVERR